MFMPSVKYTNIPFYLSTLPILLNNRGNAESSKFYLQLPFLTIFQLNIWHGAAGFKWLTLLPLPIKHQGTTWTSAHQLVSWLLHFPSNCCGQGKQQRIVQSLGTLGDPEEAPGAWLLVRPAPAVVTIWIMQPVDGDLTVSPLCKAAFPNNNNNNPEMVFCYT